MHRGLAIAAVSLTAGAVAAVPAVNAAVSSGPPLTYTPTAADTRIANAAQVQQSFFGANAREWLRISQPSTLTMVQCKKTSERFTLTGYASRRFAFGGRAPQVTTTAWVFKSGHDLDGAWGLVGGVSAFAACESAAFNLGANGGLKPVTLRPFHLITLKKTQLIALQGQLRASSGSAVPTSLADVVLYRTGRVEGFYVNILPVSEALNKEIQVARVFDANLLTRIVEAAQRTQ
jgi:hypothetical protein